MMPFVYKPQRARHNLYPASALSRLSEAENLSSSIQRLRAPSLSLRLTPPLATQIARLWRTPRGTGFFAEVMAKLELLFIQPTYARRREFRTCLRLLSWPALTFFVHANSE